MKNLLTILILIILTSCSQKSEKEQEDDVKEQYGEGSESHKEIGDTIVAKMSNSSEANHIICKPSEKFVRLVEYMQSKGYNKDTFLVDKVSQKSELVDLIIVDYEKTYTHHVLSDSAQMADLCYGEIYDPIVDSIFESVGCILEYTWRISDSEHGLKRRGGVMEWNFLNKKNAKFVYDFVKRERKKIGFPFIKTRAYYLLKDNYVYMFHSGHSGVAYRNKPFYEWFKIEVEK